MSRSGPWRVLGIDRTAEAGAIRRAYADKLRALDVDKDPAAYAALRDARDEALAWARRQDAPPPAPPTAPEDDPFALPADLAAPETGLKASGEAWPHAAPVVELPEPEGGLRVSATVATENTLRPLAPPPQSGELRDLGALPEGDPWAVPVLGAHDPALGEFLVQPVAGQDGALHALLFPGEEHDERAFDADELAAARRHLRAILADAAQGDLALHDRIEGWLADVLAGAWPRSAPLLEPAAEAFGWEREAGQLSERPAVAFLNARLKGLRFTRKVEQPDHVYHKAWVELSRPGRRNVFSRFRAGKGDVAALLEGVRKHFPEVESYLDPQRIASWEQGATGGPSLWFWGVAVIVFFRLIVAIGDMGGRDQVPSPPPVTVVDTASLDRLTDDIFGEGMTFAEVEKLEPEIAGRFRDELTAARTAREGDDVALRRIQGQVRGFMHAAGWNAGVKDLETASRLRLAYLRASRDASAKACMYVLRNGDVESDVELPQAVLRQERAFARSLIEAGRLEQYRSNESGQVSVPGVLVDRVSRQIGLEGERYKALYRNEGSDKDRCNFAIALKAAALDYRGKERDSILRVD